MPAKTQTEQEIRNAKIAEMNIAMLNTSMSKKKSSFIGDARDGFGEAIRATNSLLKSVTHIIDENRAEMISDMDPEVFQTMMLMRKYGL